VAVNSLISIYGSGLASSTASAAYPRPLRLADTVVAIDGVLCPLNYVGSSQVNALIPAQIQPGSHTLTVQNLQGQANTDLMIVPVLPTLFTLTAYPDKACIALPGYTPPGCFAAAALDANYALISSSNPASPGQRIALFATGLGATTVGLGGLARANVTPSVGINSTTAVVTFAGRAPGYEGLDQINIQIPYDIPPSFIDICGNINVWIGALPVRASTLGGKLALAKPGPSCPQ
jgi:uncharacterized protein (TIGR03437 family)